MNYLAIAKWLGIGLAVLFLCLAVYFGFIRPSTKPNPSTTNKADVIYNYTIQPRSTFGCSAFLIKRERDDKQEIQLENTSGRNPSSTGGNPIPDGRVGELPKTS